MTVKMVRWVASVYGRALPALREATGAILREYLELKVQLPRWMEGSRGTGTTEAASGIRGDNGRRAFGRVGQGRGTDARQRGHGSGREGREAVSGAVRDSDRYRGGIMMAWEKWVHVEALDSGQP